MANNDEAAIERRRQQNEELKARDRERRAACAREGHTPLGDTCSRCGINMNFKGRRAHVKGRI